MAALVVLTLSFILCVTAQTVVDLGYAQYQGTFNDAQNITTFLGIRYAAPPIGELRFRAPQAPQNTSGIQLANTQPPTCFQASSGRSPSNPLGKRALPPEDCLFLNVFTPNNATLPLPVIIYIHGGGYLGGSIPSHNGTDLIRASNYNVVSVVIQYRLGVFGFLPGRKVKENGSLNAGLLDQNFAFRWVQDHISKFGGDRSRVTIWGKSAGAGSVLQHVIAEDGQMDPPLFRAAITSSTFLPSQYRYDDRIPEFLYSTVVDRANCTSSQDTLACLRAVEPGALQAVNSAFNLEGFYGTFLFVPVVDGTYIRQRPILAMAQKKVNGEALLAITNTFEGRAFVNQSTASVVTASRYAGTLFPEFSEEQSQAVATAYAGLGTPINQVIAIQGEAIFTCPTYYLLDAFKGRSWKGLFAIPNGDHSDDSPYYWPTGRTPKFNNSAFIKAFASGFLNFAVTLDPNEKVSGETITPLWSGWTGTGKEMLFNRTEGAEPWIEEFVTDDGLRERCQLWESVGETTGQ